MLAFGINGQEDQKAELVALLLDQVYARRGRECPAFGRLVDGLAPLGVLCQIKTKGLFITGVRL